MLAACAIACSTTWQGQFQFQLLALEHGVVQELVQVWRDLQGLVVRDGLGPSRVTVVDSEGADLVIHNLDSESEDEGSEDGSEEEGESEDKGSEDNSEEEGEQAAWEEEDAAEGAGGGQ